MPFKPNFLNADTDATTVNISMVAAADAIDQNVYIATRPVRVLAIREVHGTAGTDASAVTLAVMKCTGTQAPASGTIVHSGTANLKGTAQTVQSLTVLGTSAARLATGDRLALDIVGTPTAYATGLVTIVLRPA